MAHMPVCCFLCCGLHCYTCMLKVGGKPIFRGGRVVRWCWVNFQCRGVLLIWITVGQGPTALAVGADGDC